MNNSIQPLTRKSFRENSDAITELYITIFGEEPWNEGYVCLQCKTLSPLSRWVQTCCWSSMKTFYDPWEVKKDFEKRLGKQNAIANIIQNQLENLLWFSLWWWTTLEEVNDEKLWLDETSLKSLQESSSLNNDEKIFYLAELWVIKEQRWQWLATQLYEDRLSSIKQQWFTNILVRTTKKTDKPFSRYTTKLWFQEVFSYNDSQQRVILLLTLNNNE